MGSQTVLIVDDDEQFAELIAATLRSRGFETATASNGLHGYAGYFRKATDWVVTDLNMAELDGIEMMRCIRALNPRVKTVYMSGAVDDHRPILDREIHEFGASVISKPFTSDSLIERMTRTITDRPAGDHPEVLSASRPLPVGGN